MITQDDLQGHWCRDWIKATGVEDHTTRVHWLQADTLFADLRVPLVRPDITGFACLADLPPAALDALRAAEGFAGTITVAAGRCTWQREINWQGRPEMDDIGMMSFEDGALMEDGVLATYRERWLRLSTTPLRGHRLTIDHMSGVLIENDDVFLVGMGPALDAQIATGPQNESAEKMQFASTYCLGKWEGDLGIAQLSTNPFCEGQVVLTRGATFAWHAPAFDGSTEARDLRAA